MILNETKAMFNGQLLFDRPMHVKMVSTFRFLLVFELIMSSRLFFLDDVWLQGWCDLPRANKGK